MTPAQNQLVRDSFPIISELSGPIAMLFYGRLFQIDPRLRPMFKQDIELQGRKLMDMLTTLTANLDCFEDLVPMLKALGQRHAGYGVRPEHYELVTTALIWAFGTALDREFYPELRGAWRTVIELAATVMKEGAAELPPSPADRAPGRA
jgi:hemoglobin-like flavoprotein